MVLFVYFFSVAAGAKKPESWRSLAPGKQQHGCVHHEAAERFLQFGEGEKRNIIIGI